jgi:hypothetical protein
VQGRLAGLQHKLADIATLVFIDAPYVLPFWYKPAAAVTYSQDQQQQQHQQYEDQPYLYSQQQQQLQQGFCQQTARCRSALPQQPTQQQLQGPSCGLPAPKRAWLLSRELLQEQPQLQAALQQQQQPQQIQQAPGDIHEQDHDSTANLQTAAAPAAGLTGWQVAPAAVTTADQHSTQCCGWQASWQVIQEALSGTGLGLQQVDGLLGFSQGAAVVAAVVAELQRQQHQQQQAGSGGSSSRPAVEQPLPLQGPRFAILASGFVSPAPEHQELLQEQQPLQLPSLHVYAAAGAGCACSGDRQIQQQLSDELYQLWEPAARERILHDGGHLIPCRKEVVKDIKAFLQLFMTNQEQQ